MYSKEINLDDLLNGKTAVFKPNEYFNIIVGENGTGKSDLIKNLEEFLKGPAGEDVYNLTVFINDCTNKEVIKLINYYVHEKFETMDRFYLHKFLANAEIFCKSKFFYENGELLVERGGAKRDLDWLSSGELRYLSLILPVCISNNRAVIFVADDIETHLSIQGQKHLLTTFHDINPNAQFFITTHSPSIFIEHEDDVLYIDDILKD